MEDVGSLANDHAQRVSDVSRAEERRVKAAFRVFKRDYDSNR